MGNNTTPHSRHCLTQWHPIASWRAFAIDVRLSTLDGTRYELQMRYPGRGRYTSIASWRAFAITSEAQGGIALIAAVLLKIKLRHSDDSELLTNGAYVTADVPNDTIVALQWSGGEL